jgi:hypothetical protein
MSEVKVRTEGYQVAGAGSSPHSVPVDAGFESTFQGDQ